MEVYQKMYKHILTYADGHCGHTDIFTWNKYGDPAEAQLKTNYLFL